MTERSVGNVLSPALYNFAILPNVQSDALGHEAPGRSLSAANATSTLRCQDTFIPATVGGDCVIGFAVVWALVARRSGLRGNPCHHHHRSSDDETESFCLNR